MIESTDTSNDILALKVSRLSVAYGQTVVLRDLSIEVAQGSVTALVGPNGAGKSTLLKAVSGLLRPQAGSVSLYGEEMTSLETYQRSNRGLCHIPEGRAVYRTLTVRDNLKLQAPAGQEKSAIDKAVDVFPILGKRLGQDAGTMSGGEQQMLAMAAAYVRENRLIIVDEPSLGLSPVMVDQIYEFLRSVAAQGIALLLVDQYVERAMAMADNAYVLRRGEVVYDGSPRELMSGDVFEHYLGS